ncbi:Ppx/GppA phosphatase family protein [Roseivirga sp. E12]|uniref:Ppx/GppA phosphatase family protein n=1 Tax=Roseivirga sp. E12 TaxID=2819237 RepID=UPI001ABCAD72|nr:phosphatase [Roseivirga sp. E12]MBO3697568.1 phosphatase [Roseivirga sp. E12]
MKLAAIDIGSNAIRFQVTNVINYDGELSYKRLEYIRFPLRLGDDVFKHHIIGTEKEDRFFRLMNAFKLLIDLYEVDDYYACATSAMRESNNGRNIVQKVRELLGLHIHIIDGDEEAKFINNVVLKDLSQDTFLHIDVGGGSTELNIIQNRVNLDSQSFKLGSVRTLEQTSAHSETGKMTAWISVKLGEHATNIQAIGTGGNIQKLYELSYKSTKERLADITKLEPTLEYLKNLSHHDKINKLRLNPDRADVIVPAGNIYLNAMKAANAKTILIPDVGLKDGIMQMLYEKHIPDSLLGL